MRGFTSRNRAMSGRIRSMSAGGFAGILDSVTTATHYWSEKLLRAQDAGTPLVRMREDNGDTEADFSLALDDLTDDYGSGVLKNSSGQTRAQWLTANSASNAYRADVYDPIASKTASQNTTTSQPLENSNGTVTCDTGDELDTSNLSTTGDFSAEIICYLVPKDDNAGTAWLAGNTSVAGEAFGLVHNAFTSTADTLSVGYAGGRTATFHAVTQAPHVVRVRKTPGAINTTTRLWVDGSEQTMASGNATTPNLAAAPFRIGGDSAFGRWDNILGTVIAKFGGVFTDAEAALLDQWFIDAYGIS